MSLSREDIRIALSEGEPERLVGQFESDYLECKREVYDLSIDAGRYELSKDCAALANAGGGLLLLGLSTRTSPALGKDEIVACNGVDAATFNEAQARATLNNWTFPPIAPVTIQTVAVGPMVVIAIEIPSIASEWPVIVKKILNDDGRGSDIAVAVCVRRGDSVGRLTPERLQALLRDGSRLQQIIQGEFSALHDSMAQVRASINAIGQEAEVTVQTAPAARNVRRELPSQAINAALAVAGLPLDSAFVLAATATQGADLWGLFESRDSYEVQLLESPPTVRNGGFEIDAGDRTRIVAGSIRRAVAAEDCVLEAHRDGTVIYATRNDDDVLTRGSQRRPHQAPRVNQLLLVEMTYLFVRLVCELYRSQMVEVRFRVELRGLERDGRRIELQRGPFGGMGPSQDAGSPQVSVELIAVVAESPERIAARLLGLIYNEFGFDADQVPYTHTLDGVRAVNVEAIRQPHT